MMHILPFGCTLYVGAQNFQGIQFSRKGLNAKILQSNFRGWTFQNREPVFRPTISWI